MSKETTERKQSPSKLCVPGCRAGYQVRAKSQSQENRTQGRDEHEGEPEPTGANRQVQDLVLSSAQDWDRSEGTQYLESKWCPRKMKWLEY